MEKLYRLVVTQIDPETKEHVKDVLDEELTAIGVIGDCGGDKCAEVMINVSVAELATMIASSRHLSSAAKLALVMERIKRDSISDMESALAEKIFGGDE